jgi:hypothetical protein
VVTSRGIGQSSFLWYLRGIPSVKKAFETIWETSHLLVSFDGCGIFRPPEYDENWMTEGGWYHIDQNVVKRVGRHSVQGFVNLIESGPDDGGLVVWPKSFSLIQDHFARRRDLDKKKGDFVSLRAGDPFWKEAEEKKLRPIKINLDAGDLVMWDSRTVHCNCPAKIDEKKKREEVSDWNLRRLVAYICMTPASMVKDEQILNNRINAVLNGVTTNHWPHEYKSNGGSNIEIPKLDEHQKLLIADLPRVNRMSRGRI